MKRTSGEILGSDVGIEPVRLKKTNCRTDLLYHSIIFDQSITIHPPIHHSIGMCIKIMYIIIYIHLYIHLYIYIYVIIYVCVIVCDYRCIKLITANP